MNEGGSRQPWTMDRLHFRFPQYCVYLNGRMPLGVLAQFSPTTSYCAYINRKGFVPQAGC